MKTIKGKKVFAIRILHSVKCFNKNENVFSSH